MAISFEELMGRISALPELERDEDDDDVDARFSALMGKISALPDLSVDTKPDTSLRPQARDLSLTDTPRPQPSIQDTFQPTTAFRVPDQPLLTGTERLTNTRRVEPVKPDYSTTMGEVSRAAPARSVPEQDAGARKPEGTWSDEIAKGLSAAAAGIGASVKPGGLVPALMDPDQTWTDKHVILPAIKGVPDMASGMAGFGEMASSYAGDLARSTAPDGTDEDPERKLVPALKGALDEVRTIAALPSMIAAEKLQQAFKTAREFFGDVTESMPEPPKPDGWAEEVAQSLSGSAASIAASIAIAGPVTALMVPAQAAQAATHAALIARVLTGGIQGRKGVFVASLVTNAVTNGILESGSQYSEALARPKQVREALDAANGDVARVAEYMRLPEDRVTFYSTANEKELEEEAKRQGAISFAANMATSLTSIAEAIPAGRAVRAAVAALTEPVEEVYQAYTSRYAEAGDLDVETKELILAATAGALMSAPGAVIKGEFTRAGYDKFRAEREMERSFDAAQKRAQDALQRHGGDLEAAFMDVWEQETVRQSTEMERRGGDIEAAELPATIQGEEPRPAASPKEDVGVTQQQLSDLEAEAKRRGLSDKSIERLVRRASKGIADYSAAMSNIQARPVVESRIEVPEDQQWDPQPETEVEVEPAPILSDTDIGLVAKAEPKPTTLLAIIGEMDGIAFSPEVFREYDDTVDNELRSRHQRGMVVRRKGTPGTEVVRQLQEDYPELGITTEQDLLARVMDWDSLTEPITRRTAEPERAVVEERAVEPPVETTPPKPAQRVKPTTVADIIRQDFGGIIIDEVYAPDFDDQTTRAQKVWLTRNGIVRKDGGTRSDLVADYLAEYHPEFGVTSQDDLISLLSDRDRLQRSLDMDVELAAEQEAELAAARPSTDEMRSDVLRARTEEELVETEREWDTYVSKGLMDQEELGQLRSVAETHRQKMRAKKAREGAVEPVVGQPEVRPEPVVQPGPVAQPAGRTLTIRRGNEDVVVDLTPEQADEWDRVHAEHESMREYLRRTFPDPQDRQEVNKRLKAVGMRESADKRRITGMLTLKEQAQAEKEAKALRAGRDVVVSLEDGETERGTIVKPPAFGKVRVRLQDGTERLFPAASTTVTEAAQEPAQEPERPTYDFANLTNLPEPVEGGPRESFYQGLEDAPEEGRQDALRESHRSILSELMGLSDGISGARERLESKRLKKADRAEIEESLRVDEQSFSDMLESYANDFGQDAGDQLRTYVEQARGEQADDVPFQMGRAGDTLREGVEVPEIRESTQETLRRFGAAAGKKLNQQYKMEIGEGTFTEVEIDTEEARAAKKLGEMYGKRVIFATSSAPVGFNGAAFGSDIILMEDSENNLLRVAAHELFHVMSRESPDLAASVKGLLAADTEGMSTYRAALEKRIGGPVDMTDGEIVEEFGGDILGDMIQRPDFLRQMARKDPTLIERVRDFFDDVLRKLRATFTDDTYAVSPYVQNIKEVRGALATAMRDYKESGNRPTELSAGVGSQVQPTATAEGYLAREGPRTKRPQQAALPENVVNPPVDVNVSIPPPDAPNAEQAGDFWPVGVSFQRRADVFSRPEMRTPKWKSVNRRLSHELEVAARLLNRPATQASPDVVQIEGVSENAVPWMAPQNLADLIYTNIDHFRALRREGSLVDVARDAGLLGDAAYQELRGTLPDVVNDRVLQSIAKRAGKQQGAVSVDEAQALRDLYILRDDSGELLSENGKAGNSTNLLLASCNPSEGCANCYAAEAYIRQSNVRRAMHDTVFLLTDPIAYGRKLAEDAKKKSVAEMPFLRLHGSGDMVFTEQIEAYNELARNMDRPIHVFSRRHDMLAELQGTPSAPFLKMGSVDAHLVEAYGMDYLSNNMSERGIANAYLYSSPADIPIMEELYQRDALQLVLAADKKLHDVLPEHLKASSCPCDAGERHYQASCRRCALSSSGCFMAFSDVSIAPDGSLYKLSDLERPETAQPMLGFVREQNPVPMWSSVVGAILRKSKQLITDGEVGQLPKFMAKKEGAGGDMKVTLRDLRRKDNLYLAVEQAGRRWRVVGETGELAFGQNERRKTLGTFDTLDDAKGYVKQRTMAYVDHLNGLLKGSTRGTFWLPHGEIQKRVAYREGRGLPDDAAAKVENAERGTFKVGRGLSFQLRRDGGGVRVASAFSGGGVMESALQNASSVMAVEADPRVAALYNTAHGTDHRARGVQDVTVEEVRESNPDVFHASPPCKNFSLAKSNRSVLPQDWENADFVARVIQEVKPPVVTVENVPAYQNTVLFTHITDALNAAGYTWEVVEHDAADYGALQHRNRILLRAVRDGELPPAPEPVEHADWYTGLSDLIESAPRAEMPPVERQRIDEMISRGKLDGNRPIISMGGSGFGGTWSAANDGGPAPTFKAAKEKPKVILPGGDVRAVTIPMMARLMGVPDDYALPAGPTMAKQVLGNGIDGHVTEALIQPLLDQRSTADQSTPTQPPATDPQADIGADQPAAEPEPLFQLGSRDDRALKQRIKSAATSRPQVAAGLRKIQWQPGAINFDIGGGKYDLGTEYLRERGVTNLLYDPQNRSAEHNATVVQQLNERPVDTVTVLNVLNVLEQADVRDAVIRQAARALKPGGTAYFQVYEGDRSGVGRVSKVGPGGTPESWQENRRIGDYLEEIERHFATVVRQGELIVAKSPIDLATSPEPDIQFQLASEAGVRPEHVERARREWEEKGTDSTFFRRWFSGSKVVAENNKPMVVYHGSRSDGFDRFDEDRIGSQTDDGWLGSGFYFTSDANVASSFAGMGNSAPKLSMELTDENSDVWTKRARGNGALGAFFVALKNPLTLRPDGWRWDKKAIVRKTLGLSSDAAAKTVTEALRSHGFDGVILDYSGGGYGHSEVVALYPEQIKSATGNRGTFDAEDPDIRFQLASEAGARPEHVERARREWQEKGTESPFFKRWFKQSAASDESGKPVRVFHGTDRSFDAFNVSLTDLGAHFSVDPNVASAVADDRSTSRYPRGAAQVYSGYLSLQNPLRLQDTGKDWSWESLQDQLQSVGILDGTGRSDSPISDGPFTSMDDAVDAANRSAQRDQVDYTVVENEDGEYEVMSAIAAGADRAVVVHEAPYREDATPDEEGQTYSPKEIVDAIEAAGYDGIVYLNRQEIADEEGYVGTEGYDPWYDAAQTDEEFLESNPLAQDSYIIFHPEQFKSDTGNQGTFDAGDPAMVRDDAEQPAIGDLVDEPIPVETTGKLPKENKESARELAVGIRRELETTGYVDMRGKKVSSGHDLAVIAQPLRNPRVENIRLVYVDRGTNEVMAMESWTSNMVDAAPHPLSVPTAGAGSKITPAGLENRSARNTEAIFERVARLEKRAQGSVGVYLLHNHPSGKATPSREDLQITQQWSARVPGIPFLGHVIINSNEYAVIEPNGQFDLHAMPGMTDDMLTTADTGAASQFMGQRVSSGSDIARIGQALKAPDDWVTLVGLNTKLEVRSILEVPYSLYNNPEGMPGYLRNMSQATGTRTWVSYYGGSKTNDVIDATRKLLVRGAVYDGVWDSQSVTHSARGEGELYNEPVEPVRVQRVSEDAYEIDGLQFQLNKKAVHPAAPQPTQMDRDGRIRFDTLHAKALKHNADVWTQVIAKVAARDNQTKKQVRSRLKGQKQAMLEMIGQWRTAEDYMPEGYVVHEGSDGEVYASKKIQFEAETNAGYTRRMLQDQLSRLQNIQDASATYRDDTYNVARKADLARSAEAVALEQFDQQFISGKGSFLSRMTQAGYSVHDFGQYLMARHARPRTEALLRENPDLDPDSVTTLAGMDLDVADGILEQYADDDQIKAFAAEFDEQIISRGLDIRVEAGLISQERADELRSRWEYYVPLKSWSDPVVREEHDAIVPRSGRSGALGREFRQAKGRQSEAYNPFEVALIDYQDGLRRAATNKVRQSLLQLVLDNPSDMWSAERMKHMPVYDRDGEMVSLRPMEVGKNQLEVKVDGRSWVITINDKETDGRLPSAWSRNTALNPLYSSLTHVPQVPAFLQWYANYRRAVATTLNPVFLFTNFERDLQTLFVNATAEMGVKIGKDAVKGLPSAMKAIYNEQRGNLDSDLAQRYRELKELGGKVAWFKIEDLEGQRKKIQGRVRQYEARGDQRGMLQAAGEMAERLNEIVESAGRLSVYSALVDAGVSKEKAAAYAKEVTVNFNRHGQGGPMINAAYMFANAGIQATKRFVDIYKTPTGKKLIGLLFASGFANEIIQRMIDEDEWVGMSDYDKDNHWMIPPFWRLGEEDPEGGGYVSIKLPYVYNVPYVMGSIAAEHAWKFWTDDPTGYDVARSVARLASALDSAVNPLGGGTILQTISPTILDPVVELATNSNFHDGPIWQETFGWMESKPRHEMHLKSVRPRIKAFTSYVNSLGGGNEQTAGRIGGVRVDMNPEVLEYILEYVGGGPGRMGLDLIDTIDKAVEGDWQTWMELPVVKQHFRQPSEWVPRRMAQRWIESARVDEYSPDQRRQFFAGLKRAVRLEAMTQEEAQKLVNIFENGQRVQREKRATYNIDPYSSANDLRLYYKDALAAVAAYRDMEQPGLAHAAQARADYIARLGGGLEHLQKQWTAEQRKGLAGLVRDRKKEYLEHPDWLARDMNW